MQRAACNLCPSRDASVDASVRLSRFSLLIFPQGNANAPFSHRSLSSLVEDRCARAIKHYDYARRSLSAEFYLLARLSRSANAQAQARDRRCAFARYPSIIRGGITARLRLGFAGIIKSEREREREREREHARARAHGALIRTDHDERRLLRASSP